MQPLIEYLAKYDEDFEGVFAISLVDRPANEFLFVNLSKAPVITQLQVVDEEKRLVTGVVLVPDQKILRYDEQTQEHYYLIFKEEDILKFSREFIKKGYQKNSTENHDYGKQIENLTFVETWIVQDPTNDKANALGFDVPKGTWMVSGYVEDDDILTKIKNKELNGFSIDGILKKVKHKKNTNMSFLDKLFALVKEETKLQEITTDDLGVLTVEKLELGFIVYDADMNPVPNIEFEFEGWIYKTDENGAINLIDEKPEDEIDIKIEEAPVEEAPAPAEEPISEEPLEEVVMENGDVFTSESFSVGDSLFLNGELYISQTTDIEGRRITTDENGIITSNEEIIAQVDELKAQLSGITKEKEDAIEALKAEYQTAIDKIAALEAQVEALSAAPATGKLKAINDEDKDKNPLTESKYDVFNRIAKNYKK